MQLTNEAPVIRWKLIITDRMENADENSSFSGRT